MLEDQHDPNNFHVEDVAINNNVNYHVILKMYEPLDHHRFFKINLDLFCVLSFKSDK